MLSETFVLVPSYNHAPFIEECLRSIISQTIHPIKLLVIDDGSKDGSPAIIEKVLAECPFDTELIVRENRGLCRTLNEGFLLSTGKYFAYLGSDDYWLPTFLESRTAMLNERESAVLAYGNASLVEDDGQIYDSTAEHNDKWAQYLDGDPRVMLLRGVAPISSTVFYRRAALNGLLWNEHSRLEDYEMYLNLMTLGDFAFDPRVLSAWRRHGYNTSGDRSLMLDEVLSAQLRNVESLGLNASELERIQTQITFQYARIELQHGNKGAALQLAGKSWRGASFAQLGKFAVRMIVPNFIVNRRRQMRAT